MADRNASTRRAVGASAHETPGSVDERRELARQHAALREQRGADRQREEDYAAGARDARRAAGPSSSSSRPGAGLPAAVSGAGDDVGGFVIALVGYALLAAYLRGGPAEVKGWLRAKFFNQPYTKAKAKPAAAATAAKPAPPDPHRVPTPAPAPVLTGVAVTHA